MGAFDEFSEIVVENELLSKYTSLKVGGPARWFARPRTIEELSLLVRRCGVEGVPYRIMGAGSNILAPDEGTQAVVIQLMAPRFHEIRVDGAQIRAGAGAELPALIAESCTASLSGLEVLVGIPGAVGGALRRNAGGRTGDIGQFVTSATVMNREGEINTRMKADIRFSYRESSLDDAIILDAQFDLVEDNQQDIVRRLKKIWIAKKAHQPFGFQSCGYIFRNPRGLSADELIESAELRGTKVGGAELCARDPKFITTQQGATSRDVSRLIDLVRSKVHERSGVTLDLQIDVW